MTVQASGWVPIVTPTAADTKGSWIELIASTSFASKWMLIQMVGAVDPNEAALFDVGTGGAGSEVEVISDQQFHPRNQSGGSGRGTVFSFPMVIPAGTRISIRAEHEGGIARTYDCTMDISDFVPSSSVPNVIQSSGAKQVSSPASAGNVGSWVELVSSLDNAAVWLALSLYSIASAAEADFDIGIGAAGSESVIYPNIGFIHFLGGGNTCSMGAYFPITIGAGVRVAIRVRDDNAGIKDYEVGALFS